MIMLRTNIPKNVYFCHNDSQVNIHILIVRSVTGKNSAP